MPRQSTVSDRVQVCEHCEQEFVARAIYLRRGGVRFCSNLCARAAAKRPPMERFLALVDRSGPGCWPWLGSIVKSTGYGRFWDGEKPESAHVASWVLHFGRIPGGLWVLHTCDTRACVRPDHLTLGDNLENMRQMRERGRSLIGDRNIMTRRPDLHKHGSKSHLAVLTDSQVIEIRGLYASGVNMTQIAKRFPTSRTNVSRIVHGHAWKETPPI